MGLGPAFLTKGLTLTISCHDNLIVYVSSRNNYNMLLGEILNINFDGYEFVNVDDDSCKEEKAKGENICKSKNITFLVNKSRGVQFATQTLIDFINKNRPNCKWIICLQHDNYPLSVNFFSRISKLIQEKTMNQFGSMGFNVIDPGKYSGNSLELFKNNQYPLAMLGLCHLSVRDAGKRWICPNVNDIASKNPDKWSHPFIIEIPFWSTVGISVDVWNKHVIPTTDYQFHLWCPDVIMQMNKNNKPCLVLPRLYCMNDQGLKRKYGIPVNSASAARKGDKYHFGEYGPHLDNFKKRWGWDYENVKTFKRVRAKYKDTLIYKFYRHDISCGPLMVCDLGDY